HLQQAARVEIEAHARLCLAVAPEQFIRRRTGPAVTPESLEPALLLGRIEADAARPGTGLVGHDASDRLGVPGDDDLPHPRERSAQRPTRRTLARPGASHSRRPRVGWSYLAQANDRRMRGVSSWKLRTRATLPQVVFRSLKRVRRNATTS